jgi:ABC-2 type transport system ATP-binding protein
MTNILEIHSLSKSYRTIKAIDKLSLSIEEGQAYGLLGPNGSGKTTTLSIITGILKQDSGSFQWFGDNPSAKQRIRIGSLIETPHFYPYLNLERNLKILCEIKNQNYSDIERSLKETKLYDRRKSKFRTLSLGMKQRLGIAAALLGNPEVLVLDEPTNGLDPEGIAEVRETVLEQVDRGKTLIIASHILSEVERICSHLAILKQGNLLVAGSVKELLAEEEIIEFASSDNETLLKKLKGSKLIKEIEVENGKLSAILEQDVSSADINSFSFENNITLTHLMSKKKSLETQFLELVKE